MSVGFGVAVVDPYVRFLIRSGFNVNRGSVIKKK